MANRIYFANQQVVFRRDNATTWKPAHGVQSVAVTTTFNLEQAFELGQLSIYENIEGVPDIEMTMSKVLDGYPLLYHLATNEAAAGTAGSSMPHGPTLAGRSDAKIVVGLGVWPDTTDSASGNPAQMMEASGMFCSAISYNFPLEDNFSEDITLVGNNKGWHAGPASAEALDCANPGWTMANATGFFPGNNDSPAGTGGVNRRENLAFAAANGINAGGVDYTYLPTEVPGVSSSGWMSPTQNTSNTVHLQSITCSTDLGREELFELGTRQPYARVVTFPIEVTCDIEVLSLSGDMINAFADGCTTSTDPCTGIVDNLSNQRIRIATCEGTRIYLGDKNKLASVNYGGGDAGGGNVTVTYSYSTFNDFTVLHPNDPSDSGPGWWAARSTYLGTGPVSA